MYEFICLSQNLGICKRARFAMKCLDVMSDIQRVLLLPGYPSMGCYDRVSIKKIDLVDEYL